jgi:methyl-accepting chemotaxis protein
MGLRLKFNLVLSLVTLLGLIGSGLISYQILQKNARAEVLEMARMMMESAIAVRSYTVDEIKPLLAVQQRRAFIPQTVPAYAASQYIHLLQKSHSEYSYKEATLNPTNPANRTTGWEADIVNQFRNHPNVKELIGERDTPTGPQLFIGHPITITNSDCLTCHSTPAEAPKTLLDSYGSNNGFGWKLNETVGAQIVAVPMSLPLQRARITFISFMLALTLVFVVTAIIFNVLLHFIVLKPVRALSAKADEISMGDLTVEELEVKGNDEIASLGHSFTRMQRSLGNAVKMLNETDDVEYK